MFKIKYELFSNDLLFEGTYDDLDKLISDIREVWLEMYRDGTIKFGMYYIKPTINDISLRLITPEELLKINNFDELIKYMASVGKE